MIITNKATRKGNSSSRTNEWKSSFGIIQIDNRTGRRHQHNQCNHHNQHKNNNNQTSRMHDITFSRTLHANIDDIRPIPTPNSSIFNKCVTPDPYAPTKQRVVPDSTQRGEARRKLAPLKHHKSTFSTTVCQHPPYPLSDFIHNTTILIHFNPIYPSWLYVQKGRVH